MGTLFDQRPLEEALNRYERSDQIELNEKSFCKVPYILLLSIKNLPRYEEYLWKFCIFPFQSDTQTVKTCHQNFQQGLAKGAKRNKQTRVH